MLLVSNVSQRLLVTTVSALKAMKPIFESRPAHNGDGGPTASTKYRKKPVVNNKRNFIKHFINKEKIKMTKRSKEMFKIRQKLSRMITDSYL